MPAALGRAPSDGVLAVLVRDEANLRESFDPGVLFVELDPSEGFLHEVLDVLEIEAFKNSGPAEATIEIRHLPRGPRRP